MPPVGSLRFRYAQDFSPCVGDVPNVLAYQTSDDVRCSQLSNVTSGDVVGSEDCLFLTVYRPMDTNSESQRPIQVFLHGGSLLSGSSTSAENDYRQFAGSTGNLVLAPNYRLGPFGFLALRALSETSVNGTSGNMALSDVISALRWIHIYGKAFGGDPTRISLLGQVCGCFFC